MNILIVGAAVGAIVGVLHATYVYRVCVDSSLADSCSPASAAYHALWTFGLWVLCGSYLLVLWLAALVIFGVVRLIGKGSGP